MLAMKPTNLSHDIAPAWLVSEASLFAQGEHKRRERAKAQRGESSTRPKEHPRELGEDEELRNKEVAADRPQPPLKADTVAVPHGQLLAHWGRRHQVKQQKTEEQTQRMMSFPARSAAAPLFPNSSSARLRNGFSKRLRLWKYTVGLIHFLNFMHVGTNRHKQKLSGSAARAEPNHAQRAAWRHLFELSRAGLRVRREVTPTGGQSAVAVPVKSAKVDAMGYASVSKTHAQVPMEAARIVEPSGEHVVDMLQALPCDESQFYSHEENVIDHTGKSKVIQHELEQQCAFVGGCLDEYVSYFHRQDVPASMWERRLFRDVKAVAGFSVDFGSFIKMVSLNASC